MTKQQILRPFPVFDYQHKERRSQAMIFVAALEASGKAASGEGAPHFEYTPREPLVWLFRPAGEAAGSEKWRVCPSNALVQLDHNYRVVQLLVDQLDIDGTCVDFELAVTEGELQPSNAPALSLSTRVLPPAVVYRIDGQGSESNGPVGPVAVSLNRTRVPNTKDEILWVVIRNSANSLGFNAYQDFMDSLFDSPRLGTLASLEKRGIASSLDFSPDTFLSSSVDAFRVLQVATELFVMTRCGVVRGPHLQPDPLEEEARFGHRLPGEFEKLWESYLSPIASIDGKRARILPYLDLIRRKLGDVGTARGSLASVVDHQASLIQEKLVHPVLIELIWSYWHEEGMLVQAFNSISRRFQNLRTNGERDPLAQLEIDPLRPLNSLLFGWVQDEQSRLSVLRRAHEYEHQYGFTLQGRALAELRAADRRSKFLEALHNLLHKCSQFFLQDDQTTVIADAFPVLNSLKETHYLLAQGAHNQFGNLTSVARQEMLMQQWILARPEMREFLGTRVMVPYAEAWMDRVDSLKTLKGWTDTSSVHFRDLATFGEQILLSVRWGAWSTVTDPASAANWARYWRPEIQGYIHAYRVATSVDLTSEITDQRQAETRFLPPSVHLRNRLLGQMQAPSR